MTYLSPPSKFARQSEDPIIRNFNFIFNSQRRKEMALITLYERKFFFPCEIGTLRRSPGFFGRTVFIYFRADDEEILSSVF